MVAYEGYPEIKGKTILKIFWLLHDLVLLPAILWTIERCTDMQFDFPRFVMQVLLAPCAAALILAEMTYMTYIVSTVLLVCTVILLIREKRAKRLILAEIAVFSVLLVLCILGLMSSRAFFNGAMSV